MKNLFEKWLNKKVTVVLHELQASVVVVDIKEVWGRVRFLVSPVSGKGESWVESFLEYQQ